MKPKPNARRFELPALDFKFSLTDGTNIPPPQPSPTQKVPTPPLTPSPDAKPADDNKPGETGKKNVLTVSKSPDMPLSPALSSRQGSIRRLFSRNTLHNAYNDPSAARPASRAGSHYPGDEKRRRTSGWFRRLRGGQDVAEVSEDRPMSSDDMADDHRRTATMVGPPPPMIPEFGVLETKRKSADTWGTDLFKNI